MSKKDKMPNGFNSYSHNQEKEEAREIKSGVGGFIGDLLGGGWILGEQARSRNLADRQHREEYDSPVNQVKRLQEAGLPLATMFSDSGASGQSADIAQSEVNPALGQAGNFMQDIYGIEMQERQMEIMDANKKLIENNALKAQAEADNIRKEGIIKDEDVRNLDLVRSTKIAQLFKDVQAGRLTAQQALEKAEDVGIRKNERSISDVVTNYELGTDEFSRKGRPNIVSGMIRQKEQQKILMAGQKIINDINEIKRQYEGQISEAQINKILEETEAIDWENYDREQKKPIITAIYNLFKDEHGNVSKTNAKLYLTLRKLAQAGDF